MKPTDSEGTWYVARLGSSWPERCLVFTHPVGGPDLLPQEGWFEEENLQKKQVTLPQIWKDGVEYYQIIDSHFIHNKSVSNS